MTVFEALERELDRLGIKVGESALAASALVMAQELDNPGNSATSKSMCQARMQAALERLHETAPPAKEGTKLDGIRAGLSLVGGTGT